MKYHTSLIALALTLAGCSKHPPAATSVGSKFLDLGVVEVSDGVQSRYDLGGGRVCIVTPTIQKDRRIILSMSVEESGNVLLRPRVQTGAGVPFQISVGDFSMGMTPVIKQTDEKATVLPGRHLSEQQVVEVAFKELPPLSQGSGYRCEFRDGTWEILEVQPGVRGVSSRTTNTDGKITIESTNATRVVLRVRDADGKVDPIKTP
jgi:hypothetical protein